MCEVQWSKFGRNIAVELALDPIRRKGADDFLIYLFIFYFINGFGFNDFEKKCR